MPALHHPWVHRLAVAALLVAVLLTIGLGGAVTSTEVGMAYPTWPNINSWSLFHVFYGEIAEAFGAGSALEHSHRQAGTLMGLLCIALTLATLFGKTPRGWKQLALACLLGVILQGLLGAFRVIGNDQIMAILHALGAQFCVLLLAAMAKISSPAWAEQPQSCPSPAASGLRLWTGMGIAVLFLNLIAAASLRHKEGAFSGHLVLALVASGVLLWVVRLAFTQARDQPRIRAGAHRLAWLLGIQVGLGLATWAILMGPLLDSFGSDRARFITQACCATTHLVVGVLVLVQVTGLALEARLRLHPGEPT